MTHHNFTLKWEDLSLTVLCEKNHLLKSYSYRKTILTKASGSASSGSLIAILGPSGSGKTTFLSILAGKIKNFDGKILFDNHLIGPNDLEQLSGYTYQDFIAIETLTAEEHLHFASALCLQLNRRERQRKINQIVSELNLEKTLETQIKNLSGGEKKRLALAVELFYDAPLLFCDEPTSGLDSYNATLLMQILKNQANLGRIVMVTVHQPSSQIYEHFDQIILIGNGEMIFQGTKQQAAECFDRVGLRCPRHYNPMDFYIKQIIGTGDVNVSQLIKKLMYCYEKPNDVKPLKVYYRANYIQRKKSTIWNQIYWLAWRSFLQTTRHFTPHIRQLASMLSISFVISLCYWGLTISDEISVQNFEGLLFLIATEIYFSGIFTVLTVFNQDLPILRREKNLYTPRAYFCAKSIGFVPRCIFRPLAFLMLVFAFVTFSTPSTLFFKFLIVLILGHTTGTLFGFMMSTSFSSLEHMQMLMLPLNMTVMAVAGLLSNSSTFPVYIAWIKYTSPFYYTYEAISILLWSSITELTCVGSSLPCYENGEQVLSYLGLNTKLFYVLRDVFLMIVLIVIFAITGYYGMLKQLRKTSFTSTV